MRISDWSSDVCSSDLIRSYATRDGAAVFRLPEHLDRMRRGAELLGIAFDAPRAAAATLQTLCANGHRNAYIRPLAWVGAGSFGLDVTGHSQHLMVATTPTLEIGRAHV